ncbi:MAG: hypothetical protein LKE33_01465 [Acidaminococcus sp.]|jgi:DNA-binding SARP family transcriptional activator|nr:hypothetical protein [Acidaminococcus sp.]
MSISVEMLGKAQVKKNNQLVSFPYRRAEGLFYYLVAKETISRDEAIGIFWTDCSEDIGRKNLRDALYHIKKLLGKNIILIGGKNTISINSSTISYVDYKNLFSENILKCSYGIFLNFFGSSRKFVD